MSDKNMHDDPLNRLKGAAPDPRAAAKKRALAAGMAAFEASQKESEVAPKGKSGGSRLTSIIASLKGIKIMDMRIPVGTAAIALLVLPLGYQLYSTTSMTPSQVAVERPQIDITPPHTTMPANPAFADDKAVDADTRAEVPVMAEPVAPEPVPLPTPIIPMAPITADAAAPNLGAAPSSSMLTRQAAPAGAMMESEAYSPPPPILAQPTEASGDTFTSFDEQRLKAVADEPVSTFSIDVDTASYSYVRRQLEDGYLPEPDAVRIEEMINYFPYDYPAAESATVPFQPTIGVYPTPWNPKTQLLQIGIKGYVPTIEEDKPANLVFLIDTSGSMDEADKLPLLKRAFALLLDQLSDNDTISIVTYAGSAGVALEPTTATEKAKVLAALDNLWAGGSTAGAEGIEAAYRLAEAHKVSGGTNRVILATDGDFNVGIDDPEKLEDFIKTKRDSGISLSVLGFGRGNLDDATMQALAQNGNGNASYISSFREAQKVLVEEIGGTLDMIAKDVKIQVEFNPAEVSEYRLIGYETRALNREDFNNDKVDAGDIGAGHTVTAIYEITPVGSGAELVDPLRYGQTTETPVASGGDEIAFLKMRYKLPESDVSQLIEVPVRADVVHGDIADVSDDMRFAAAVAAFGQKLKDSNFGGDMSWTEIADLARAGKGSDDSGYRGEFIQLIKTASLLKPDSAALPYPGTASDPCQVDGDCAE
ncbi:MAG: von Willebrand factor type A domain-containing protein [Candidatus Devosia phytovorans]|uniref:von Willebrand factor type A domain-containing protein n=1 Tax=Candidatus Devosia phytovorans TaxID=3121372 RepID=A0AAJ6B164_9HYPH|nr:von Willebrand factor type A domain-containing protein [Devosia sp.]WEK04989.1 MAG: von Willebrand factor type A domain-containing protein [Devosia sp.]